MRYNVDCGLMTVYRYQRFLFFSAQDLLKQNETSQFLTFIYVYLYIHTYIIIFKEVHHVLQLLLSRFLFHRLPPPPPHPPSSPPPPPTHTRASIVAQMVKNLPAIQETQVQSLGQEDLLEKGMAAHSSILACKIPRTEELGRL